MEPRVSFVTLAARDLDRSRRFYVGGLGWEPALDVPDWERHTEGDEIVMVVGGATTLFTLHGDEERAHPLGAGQLLVVPRGTWHRFETPEEVEILSVTPQPSDHRPDRPTDQRSR